MKVRIYVDTAGEWRWKITTRNGKTIADGAEGYSSRSGIIRALWRLCRATTNGELAEAIAAAAKASR
jgi:uncharacterized protein YegP (UPF0339 family)